MKNILEGYVPRQVALHKTEDLVVSTIEINDSASPFETGIRHDDYNDGSIVIVEMYDAEEDALAGHEKWLQLMTTEPLPKRLIDASTADCAKMCDTFGNKTWRVYNRKRPEEN